MAVAAVGSEVAKKMLLHGSANHYLVQTTVRDVKVKEKNKVIKVFGRSPQALYNLLPAPARDNIHLL
jgi:hypothetical protein